MNERKKLIIGLGACGLNLSQSYYRKYYSSEIGLLNFSTAEVDEAGVSSRNLVSISADGSGKRYAYGRKLWEHAASIVEQKLQDVLDTDCIVFSSSSGGSGSSGIGPIVSELSQLGRNNRILVAVILPFQHEQLPFIPNFLNCLDDIAVNHLNKASYLCFSNEQISQELNTTDFDTINNEITRRANTTLNLPDFHDKRKENIYSIDANEHNSVLWSKSFLCVDFHAFNGGDKPVNFLFGSLKNVKNLEIAHIINTSAPHFKVQRAAKELVHCQKRLSKTNKNARYIFGILRNNDLENGSYVVLANGLDVNSYLNSYKKRIRGNVDKFRKTQKIKKTLKGSDKKRFDI